MNCDNCAKPALYYVNDQGSSPSAFCNACLPPWLKVRANEGHFPLPKVEEAKPSKKASAKDEDK